MSVVMYEAATYGINKYTVERQTDASVWIDGRRSAKQTGGRWAVKFCDTFEEAKQFNVDRAAKACEWAEDRLALCEEALAKARAVTEGEV